MLDDFTYGLNTASVPYDGKNKYLRITDINDVTHKFNKTNLTSPKELDDNYLLKKGDILFARTGASVGKSYIYSSKDGRVYYAGYLIKAHTNICNNAYFIFTTTLLQKYKKFVQITSMRSGQPGINAREYRNYTIVLPQKGEQIKISALLSKIDLALDLQQKKLNQLEQLKKAMLQNLFADATNKLPNIRFIGFSEAWVQHKLDEVVSYKNGKAHERNISPEGKFIVVNSKFISTAGKVIKKSNMDICPLNKNDITFVLSDVPNGKALAKTFLIKKNNTYTLNQRIACLSPKNQNNADFLLNLINRNNYFLRYDDHVGQTNLSKNDVLSFTSYYPSTKEQSNIGKLISIISKSNDLQRAKLNQLNMLKKYFLQKLFI